MSENKIKEQKSLLWILDRLLFTLIAVCSVRGGFEYYREIKALNFNAEKLVSSLDVDAKNQLAEALFASQDEPEKKKKG